MTLASFFAVSAGRVFVNIDLLMYFVPGVRDDETTLHFVNGATMVVRGSVIYVSNTIQQAKRGVV